MSVAHRVSEILDQHVTLALESIDRMYLNGYVPRLQSPEGTASFFRFHRGQRFASSALMDPISKTFVAAIEQFALAEQDSFGLLRDLLFQHLQSARRLTGDQHAFAIC